MHSHAEYEHKKEKQNEHEEDKSRFDSRQFRQNWLVLMEREGHGYKEPHGHMVSVAAS